MTNPAFNPDDPRLTAFVLGEIDDSDRAEIEQLLETSAEAQAAVKEIEETIGVLRDGLASEPAPELTAEQRATVEQQLAGEQLPAGDVAASASSMPVTDESADRTQRAGTRFGKLAGAIVSVCALGLLTAFVLPQVQQARESSVAASRSNDERQSQLMVMDDAGESFTVQDYRSALPAGMITAETSSTKVADSEIILSPARATQPRDEIFSGPRGSLESVSGLAKMDSSTLSRLASAEKPAYFDRSSPAKGPSEPQSAQRLVADSGSRPPSDSNRKGNFSGGAMPQTARPAAGPMVERGSAAKKESQDSKPDVVSTDSPQRAGGLPNGFRPPATPVSGERAADKVSLSGQPGGAVGGKSVADAQAGNPQPSGPHTRETVVRNRVLVAPGDPSNPLLIDKSKGRLSGIIFEGGAAGSPDPANAVALLPGQNQPKKGVLFFEEIEPATGQKKLVPGKGGANGPAPTSEAGVLKQIREREKSLLRESKTERLAEQAETKPTQLAAIDSGATRRVDARGFGLAGRDLQEQLQRYNDGLSRTKSSLERMPEARQQGLDVNNETYEAIVENDFIVPVPGDKEKVLSTISIDVDTASYANMRRFLSRDQLPPANSVRIEELVNYFKYDYPEPEGNEPFSVKTDLASCPWQPSHRLAMVGLKARTIDKSQRPPTNLVFLLDVSGSMRGSNKLPLVQQSMRLLVDEMTEDDRVSIVTYASNAGVRLESTLGSKKAEILAAINSLQAGGSTNGEGGIRMAYDQANRYYFQGGANRVILCSDGDFNVGVSSDNELVELIQEKAASGVFLSVFGFGMGNLKDAKLEKLADKGNGQYGYIDGLAEAKKVFQDELVGTLYTVAKDVKLQVEFNPATVGAYRLIGYENRKLAAQDFTDDTKDAGEIGSGHTVTALYEIIPKHVLLDQPAVDGLKYQASEKKPDSTNPSVDPAEKPAESLKADDASEELLTVKLRYKKPDEEVSQAVEREFPVRDIPIAGKQLTAASNDLMFAASVASFGMNLRGSKYRGNWGFAEILETAQDAPSETDQTQRAEFVQLVQRAMRITGQPVGPQPRTEQRTTTRPGELDAAAARIKASVDGKYRRLVKKIEVRDDFQRFGAFNDYGHWDGTEYAGHKDLPPGNWVYVYPNWYIWAEAIVPAKEAVPTAEDKPAAK